MAQIARGGWGPQWETIRQKEFVKASGRCVFCAGEGTILNQNWNYDDSRNVQSLAGFSVIYDKCSVVLHIGRAGQLGRADEALGHLMQVNHISQPEAEALIERALDMWEERNAHSWIQDLGW